MPNQNRFPKKDADFNGYIINAVPHLTTNKLRLILTPTAQAKLNKVTTLIQTTTTGWNTIYQLSQNPATATKTSLRPQIESALRIIFDDIPKSLLTQIDRDILNLPLPANKHHRANNTETIPAITIKSRGHLSIILNIADTKNGTSLSKPAGVDVIEIESAFLPNTTTLPIDFPKETDFRHIANVGRTTYQRNYSDDQLKGTEYIRARYLNTRKEAGSWSEVISVVVA